MRRNFVLCAALVSFLLVTFFSSRVCAVSINVQPIRVCDDAGSNCAAISTFTDYTNKIYAQRGDSVNFMPIKQLNSSTYLTLDTVAEADALIGSTTGTQRSNGAYDMWFVKSIVDRWGRAAQGGDGVVISNAVIGANRVDTVAHELAHNLGFGHTSASITDAERYLLAEGSLRQIPSSLADVAPDGLQLDRFEAILPMISVDTMGSTPFQSTSFFNLRYLAGAASDLFLDKLSVNLAPSNAFTDPTDSPPGEAGSAFGFSNFNGLSAADVTVSGIADGSQLFSLKFARGSFAPGDSFSFGVDMDLFTNIDGFGATPDELRTTVISFEFSNGYNVSSPLDDLIAVTVFDPTTNYDRPATVFADPELIIATRNRPLWQPPLRNFFRPVLVPLGQNQAPEPGTLWLLAVGLPALELMRRRHLSFSRCVQETAVLPRPRRTAPGLTNHKHPRLAVTFDSFKR